MAMRPARKGIWYADIMVNSKGKKTKYSTIAIIDKVELKLPDTVDNYINHLN